MSRFDQSEGFYNWPIRALDQSEINLNESIFTLFVIKCVSFLLIIFEFYDNIIFRLV